MRRPNTPGGQLPPSRPAATPTQKQEAQQTTRTDKPARVRAKTSRNATSGKVMAKNAEAEEAKKKLKEAVKARKAFERDEVRRFTAHLRRRRIIWASIAGSLAAVMLFVAIGVFSPLLALRTIVVEGATRVSAEKIMADLQPEMNRPLPLVSMDSVRTVLEAQPLVKSYSTVAVPPHTLVIKIVERQPIGALPREGGFELVDPAGVSIEMIEQPIAGIPVFIVEGDSVESPGFQAAVDVVNSLPSSLAGQVQEVIANTTDDVTLVLSGGARVFWGSPENSSFKNYVLTKLLAINPVGSVSEYDVSSPNTAVVR